MRLLLLVALHFYGKSVLADKNVFDQDMVGCGPDHAAGCTYFSGDVGAHEVCVTTLPHGFSSDTGQGPWSDQFQGQPWCICIWAYSNYILQNKDLALDCKAIPSTVLEEQYSLDKFKQCGSMSSSVGCGPEDIRRSIQSLCTQCDAQALDPSSKSALKAKCDAILATAPAAPMRLYSDNVVQDKEASARIASGMSPWSLGIFGLAIAGLMVGMMVSIFQHNRGQQVEETHTSEDQELMLE